MLKTSNWKESGLERGDQVIAKRQESLNNGGRKDRPVAMRVKGEDWQLAL